MRHLFGILAPHFPTGNTKRSAWQENYKNNLSLHIHFFLFAFHYFWDRVVWFTTYLRFMTKVAKFPIVQWGIVNYINNLSFHIYTYSPHIYTYSPSLHIYTYSPHIHTYSPHMTESQDGVYAHNAMRDCFEQDMVNDRLFLPKHNNGVFCVSIITK